MIMEWISVEDRLPPYGKQKIIVFTPLLGVNFLDASIDLKKLQITHWMPLPPPPSVKE